MDCKCRSTVTIIVLGCVLAAVSSSSWAQTLEVDSSHQDIKHLLEKAMGSLLVDMTKGTEFYDFFARCSQKHGLVAVNTIGVSLNNTRTCLDKIFFQEELGRILTITHTPDASDNDDDAVTRLCNNHITDLEKCLNHFVVSLKDCTDSAGDRDLDGIKSAGKAALDYVCAHGGNRIIKFVSQMGPDCLKGESGVEMSKCLRLREPLVIQLEQNYSIFHPANCRIHAESNECVVRAFERCTNSSVTREIVQGFIDVTMNKTDCVENVSRSSGTSSTTTSARWHLCWTSLLSALALSVITWKRSV